MGKHVSYRFRRKERLDKGLRRILREQLDSATASIDEAGEDPGAAVHEVRKHVKRIRAAVRLARTRLDPGRFERYNGLCREAAHLLGGAREMNVALQTLGVVASRLDRAVDADLLEGVRVRLRDLGRGSALAIMVSDGPLAQARQRLEEARNELSVLLTSRLGPRDLAKGLSWSFRRGRRHRDEAYRTGNPEAFHAWRRRSKDLWYQLQLIQAAWPPILRARSSEHHRLADHLGLANDAVDLEALLGRDPDLVPDPRLRETIRTRCRELWEEAREEARPLGLRLYAESPRAFESILRVYLMDSFRKG